MPDKIQKLWEERIQNAKAIQKDWADRFKIEESRKYFEGEQNPGYPEDEWITVNKIYSHLMSQLPTLYSMDPYFYVKLKRSYNIDPNLILDYEKRADGRQDMLNYLKVELKLKEKARLAIQSAHFAYGAIKTHFKADEKEHPNAGEPVLDDEGNEIIDPDTGEPQVYPETLPTNKRYAIEYLNDDEILFDEDAGTLEDSWKWVAQKIKMPKKEAEKDKRFNTAAVQSAGTVEDEKKQGIFGKLLKKKEKKQEDIIVIWEIYDLKNNEWLTIAEEADKPLIKPQTLPLGIEKHPFSFLRFTLREKSPYPLPPISVGLDVQKEYNLSRSRLLTHRKRFNRKYEVVVSKLEDPDDALTKLENGDDGTLIRVMANGAIYPINDAPLDQTNLQELLMLNNDIIELLGSPDGARGIASADSATEAGILDRRLEIREGDRLSTVVDFVQDVAKKLDQLIQAHIDEDTAVKITGPQGESWRTIKTSDYEEIEGEYEYSVNVGATAPRLPDIERAQWIAFLSQVVVPFPHILTAPNVMKRMAEMFHIEDEAALEEFRQLGLKMLSGNMPMPGQQGGGPAAATMGSALGATGGNANGGGAQT